MARIKYVTRTFKMTKGHVMTLNIKTQKVDTIEFEVRDNLTSNDLLDAVKKAIDTDDVKSVAIIDSLFDTVLKGITDDDFFRNGVTLPSRTGNTGNEDIDDVDVEDGDK